MFNSRSIFNKLDEIRIVVNIKSPDFVCVVESWLDSTVDDTVITLAGYDVFRADRTSGKQGGGICCWIKDSYSVKILFFESAFIDVEILILRINHREFRCILATLYFPHGRILNKDLESRLCDYIVDTIDDFLNIYPNYSVIITGDFNHVSTTMFESAYNLENVVVSPTRLNNILDLILLPGDLVQYYQDVDILPPIGMGDHNVVLLNPITSIEEQPDRYQKVIDFRDSNLRLCLSFLNDIDWDIMSSLSLDDACDFFYRQLRKAIDTLPFDLVKISNYENKPWITNVIKVNINKRYRAYRDRNWSMFAHYRDKVKQMIYEAKKSWSNRMKCSKSIWDIKKSVIHGHSNNTNWLPQCDPNKNVFELMDIINDSLSEEFVNDPHCEIKNPIILPFLFSQKQVQTLLQKTSPKSSSGSDGIPSMIWSKLSFVIAEPLTILFNMCLWNADLPRSWKIADIVLIPKTKPPQIGQLRPISLLSIPERIFEKEFLKYLNSQLSLDSQQFGYRKGSSTTCALIAAESFITQSLQEKDIVSCHMLSIDLSKGFDKVSHRLLLDKLKNDTIDPFCILFISNYLRSRKQRIRWRLDHSDMVNVLSGVPQGSSIGPSLFGYFLSDLHIQNPKNSLMLKYADDILIISKVHKSCSESPVIAELLSAQTWLSDNMMKIREDKCIQMFFSLTHSTVFSHLAVHNIPVKSHLKFLGIIFDQTLKWNEHVQVITRKAASKLSVLRQLKPFLDQGELVTIFNCCIRSILEYAAPLFVNLHCKQRDLIEKVQRRAHTIVCGDSNCTCSNFIPLYYRRLMLGIRLFKSFVHDSSHPLHYLTPESNTYSRTFRMPLIRNSQKAKSFIVTMIQLANDGF